MKILNGQKTIEVRRKVNKDVLDKLERGEEVIVYWYCTKGKPYLYNAYGRIGQSDKIHGELDFLNGRVVVKSVLRKIEKLTYDVYYRGDVIDGVGYYNQNLSSRELYQKSCLTEEQVYKYSVMRDGHGKGHLYALHIEDLTTVNMELSHFVTWDEKRWYGEDGNYTHWKPLTKAPQNMMTVWVK